MMVYLYIILFQFVMKIKLVKSGIEFTAKEKRALLVNNDSKFDKDGYDVIVDLSGQYKSESFDKKVIESPGEYEISDILVYYLQNDAHEANGSFQNSVYFELLGDGVAYIDNLKKTISDPIVEKFGEVSVLLITIKPENLAFCLQSIREIEPKIVIPLGGQEEVDKFIKEMGVEQLQGDKNYFSMKSNELNSIQDGPIVYTL